MKTARQTLWSKVAAEVLYYRAPLAIFWKGPNAE